MKQHLLGKNILIVDDEDDIREILMDEFHLHGAQVVGASCGEEALEKAKSQVFDAIITDVRMSRGDGVWLVKNLNNSLNYKPKVFICSGFNDITPTAAKQMGVIDSFGKPFDRIQMVQAISRSLEAIS